MTRCLSVFGTRPEAVKMAPVIQALYDRAEAHSLVCFTGQHREMVEPILSLFGITPDFDLRIMRPGQTLCETTSALFGGIDQVVRDTRPDWIIAQGDTTTVLVASIVAFFNRTRFAHVEAGLRTGDLSRPFPEEFNRRVADISADHLFAPTERARQALLREGRSDDAITVTGNTVVDALQVVAAMDYDWANSALRNLPSGVRFVLVTAHRRESFGPAFYEICCAIRELAARFQADQIHFVYPVHLNPNVRAPVREILDGQPNISLLEPLDYPALVNLLRKSVIVITDSGGIQEEAPTFGVPVLIMRDTTERPEGIDAGVARLIGTSKERIVAEVSRLLTNENARLKMSISCNPYGDGHASERIANVLMHN